MPKGLLESRDLREKLEKMVLTALMELMVLTAQRDPKEKPESREL